MADLIVAALYDLDGKIGTDDSRVCLGIRFATPDTVIKMQKALVRQIRSRYPLFFDGMTPKQIEQACGFVVYEAKGDKRGFPKWVGEAGWWA